MLKHRDDDLSVITLGRASLIPKSLTYFQGTSDIIFCSETHSSRASFLLVVVLLAEPVAEGAAVPADAINDTPVVTRRRISNIRHEIADDLGYLGSHRG